jgi:NADPH:quinone reductase-like Zn-dependent oxidoreductase
MKANRFYQYGGPEVMRYEDAPDPEPALGEVLIRVRACALNHLDLDLRSAASRMTLELPFTPGMEIAGEVEALGPGVHDVGIGERVTPTFYVPCGACAFCRGKRENLCQRKQMFGVTRPGGYAERVTAPAHSLIRVPDQVGFNEAAATQVAFGTALHMLIGRAQLRRGETVLVQAAGSGVGSAAVQVAHLSGARVIATAGSEEKLQRARALGADHTINYRATDFLQSVMMLTEGRGVDIVFEHVGGEVFSKSLKCLALGGRLITCGAHGGEVTPVDVIELFRKEAAILGSYTASLFELRQVMLLVEAGRLKPVIHRAFPLAEAARAHELLAQRGHFGKLILNP